MRKLITVPPMGERKKTETLLNRWLIQVGDTIREGDELAELVTDKAAFELPSSDDGHVVKLLIPEGQVVQEGDALVEIETAEPKAGG